MADDTQLQQILALMNQGQGASANFGDPNASYGTVGVSTADEGGQSYTPQDLIRYNPTQLQPGNQYQVLDPTSGADTGMTKMWEQGDDHGLGAIGIVAMIIAPYLAPEIGALMEGASPALVDAVSRGVTTVALTAAAGGDVQGALESAVLSAGTAGAGPDIAGTINQLTNNPTLTNAIVSAGTSALQTAASGGSMQDIVQSAAGGAAGGALGDVTGNKLVGQIAGGVAGGKGIDALTGGISGAITGQLGKDIAGSQNGTAPPQQQPTVPNSAVQTILDSAFSNTQLAGLPAATPGWSDAVMQKIASPVIRLVQDAANDPQFAQKMLSIESTLNKAGLSFGEILGKLNTATGLATYAPELNANEVQNLQQKWQQAQPTIDAGGGRGAVNPPLAAQPQPATQPQPSTQPPPNLPVVPDQPPVVRPPDETPANDPFDPERLPVSPDQPPVVRPPYEPAPNDPPPVITPAPAPQPLPAFPEPMEPFPQPQEQPQPQFTPNDPATWPWGDPNFDPANPATWPKPSAQPSPSGQPSPAPLPNPGAPTPGPDIGPVPLPAPAPSPAPFPAPNPGPNGLPAPNLDPNAPPLAQPAAPPPGGGISTLPSPLGYPPPDAGTAPPPISPDIFYDPFNPAFVPPDPSSGGGFDSFGGSSQIGRPSGQGTPPLISTTGPSAPRAGSPALDDLVRGFYRSPFEQAVSSFVPAGDVGVGTGKPRQDVWNESSLRLKDALGI